MMDIDQRALKTIPEVLDFKADLAALVANHCLEECGNHGDVLASFQEHHDTPPRYSFEGVFHNRDGRPENLIPISTRAFYSSVVLICRYRPNRAEPDGMDLLRLGLILSAAKVRGKSCTPEDFRLVEILDYGIVDADLNWRSVFDVADMSKKTWCGSCLRHVYSACGEINPKPKDSEDWEYTRENHRPGCLHASSEGLI